jgi:glycosyltransferase involved in cell wall biosynthesis
MEGNESKLGFFFPIFGFEHQRYLEQRIHLLQDRPYHVINLVRAPNSAWSIPEERVTILYSFNPIIRIMNKGYHYLAKAFYRIRGFEAHIVIPPLGWKRRLRKTIAEQNIQAFIVFYGGSAILVGDELTRQGIPYSVMIEGSDSQVGVNFAWYRKRLEKVWRQSYMCIFVSRFLRDQAVAIGCPADKSIIAHNGTILSPRKPDFSLARPVRFICIGNLFPVKGYRYLLGGFHIALEMDPDISLTIVGGGWQEAELKKLVLDLGIAEKVHFTGALSWIDAQALLRDSHVFIMVSVKAEDGQEEGLGLSAIEAQAMGKPAIVSDSGGLPEVVEDGTTGLIVPQKDSLAVGRAIISLISDPSRLSKMSDAAYDRAAKYFNIERQGRELMTIRDMMLNESA